MIRPSSPLTMLLSRHTRRRAFISLLGSTAAAWPLAARAQQPSVVRRIGFLHEYDYSDPEGKAGVVAFREALQKLGWSEGRNVLLDDKSGAVSSEILRNYATEIISHNPDVVLAGGATITAALQRASRSVPIVFVHVTDPVGAGVVETLARPGGNATGFTQFEFGISAKWLVAVIRDPTA